MSDTTPFDWSTVQAGDVLVWLPTGNRQRRRALIEDVEPPATPDSRGRFVFGVELGQRLQLRHRRGVRDASKRRAFWVWDNGSIEVIRGDARVADTAKLVEESRARIASSRAWV